MAKVMGVWELKAVASSKYNHLQDKVCLPF